MKRFLPLLLALGCSDSHPNIDASVSALQAAYPEPVTIQWSSDTGDCWSTTECCFAITLNPDAPDVEEKLIHEWAHAMTWNAADEHGPEWGEAYAKCYVVVFE